MKLTSILAVAAVALVSVDRVSAADCSQDDAKQILSLTGEILVDKNCLADTNSKCPNAKCYDTLKKVTSEMPSCVAPDGTNPKKAFEDLIKGCTGTSAAAASRSTAVSAAVALASTVLAVAVVYL